jgi:hypothetical protein
VVSERGERQDKYGAIVCRVNKRVSTLASLDSSSTALCRRTTATYSLPAPCWDLTRRVALWMHTSKQPADQPKC